MSDEFLYLSSGSATCFARYSQGRGDTRREPVLILPPFGWEAVSAHRALHLWRSRLSANGHPVLAIDLPGQGDSADRLGSSGTWQSWVDASLSAAAWLRTTSERESITVLGLRLGGLLACHVAAADAAGQVVVWAAPGSGRRALRELKAFCVLETGQIVESGGPEPPPLPDDTLAPGGFLIDAQLSKELGAVDVGRLQFPPGLRALLLGADGLPPDPALVTAFETADAEITTGSGLGLAAMLTDPDQAEPPWSTFAEIEEWLEDRARPVRGAAEHTPSEAFSRLDLPGVSERPLIVPTEGHSLVGVLAELPQGRASSTTAVFLNAGAIPRIGPHRLWVDSARRFAASGVPSFRVDLAGIGDSQGDGLELRNVANFHDPSFASQVCDVLDKLEHEGLPGPFFLVGLCSGAHWAFQAALRDTRIASALLLNPRILHWDPEIEVRRDLRRTRMLGNVTIWRRLLRGEVSRDRWLAAAKSLSGAPGRFLRRRIGGRPRHSLETSIAESFDLLSGRGQSLSFVFCNGEPLDEELEEFGFSTRTDRWPTITITHIPGRDHTLRPLWMHPLVDRAIDERLSRHLRMIGHPETSGASSEDVSLKPSA